MKFLCAIALVLSLSIPFYHLGASEKHPAGKVIKESMEDMKGPRPYWEQHHPYPYSYPYPYYPYPPPPYMRYEDSRKSPYDSLSVKQAGRITVTVQPLDAEVFVDGYQLKSKEDLTYEIGLLTGIHRVDVKKDGYKPYSIEVLVEADRTIPLAIELEKGKGN